MSQKELDLTKYMVTEDRCDAEKWAWPGMLREQWSNPGGAEANAAVLGPDATPETRAETRAVVAMSVEMACEAFMTDELKNSVEFSEAEADACPEEEDAGHKTPLRICRPKSTERKKLPVVLYVFSSGFLDFEPRFFDAEIAMYATELDCVVVAPKYRIHPDHPFPAAINDLHATYLWILDHADEYGLDANHIVMTGQSAGGHFSIGLAHRLLRYHTDPMPAGVVAIAPVVDDRGIGKSSRMQWSDGGYVSLHDYQMIWESYIGYGNVGNLGVSPEAWPNHAFEEEMHGLPPMVIHANESDPNRDANIQYAQKLLDIGVFCGLHVWPGTQHGFTMSLNLVQPTDPYVLRFRQQLLEDLKGFLTYDFRRQN